MRGDIQRAIEYCLAARECVPTSNLALQLDTRITLGYEYFLIGDYAKASQTLNETIRSGITTGAVINTVASACLMARMYAVKGLLHESGDTYRMAAQSIPEASGQHLGARALVEVGIAGVFYEQNDLEAALAHMKQGLAWLPFWEKADDWVLAYITLARIHLAQANRSDASEAVEKAIQFIQTRGVFLEARHAVEIAQVKLWLAQGEVQAANRWAASLEEHISSDDRFRFENELAHITRARVNIAQKKFAEAIGLLARLEETARSAGRLGRVIEILLLKAIALRQMGDSKSSLLALTECLTLAEPEGYARVFLDEGQPMQRLLIHWLTHASAGPLRDYAIRLLSQFDAEPHEELASQKKVSPVGYPLASSGQTLVQSEIRPANNMMVEPLSPRELEVLQLIALGRTNQEIARQLVVSPGTVKAHTASIYRKLDVANRTEAAARARQLGILN
jgi:LuxR family maltose regulon positive regulatory protein